jgi:hypothetical protein
MAQEAITITVSGILEDLANGMTRKEIKEKYSLNGAQLKTIFSNPKLKGKKLKKAEVIINLVDDTEDSHPRGQVTNHNHNAETPVDMADRAADGEDMQSVPNTEATTTDATVSETESW